MALPDYLEDTSKDFAKQLTATTSVPIDTTKFTGRQFVGGEDPLQTQAIGICLLYTSPSPRDRQKSRMPSSA